MIPDHLIDQAAAAIYRATVFGDEFAIDAWQDMPEDSHIKAGTREFATAALEATAADIWDKGHVCGYSDAQDTARGIRLGAHNPYRASETA
jgi:hypothetical protein